MRKITRRSFLAAAAACGAAAALSACGGSSASSAAASSVASSTAASVSAAADGQKFTVGICQLVQHAALDAATQGFEDALTAAFGDNVTFDFQNAQGDSATCATITNGFVSAGVDLIMANATPALQAAQAATNTIPAFSDSNDLSSVCQKAADENDALYVPTDNTVAANTGIVDGICRPAKKPVFAGEEGICSGCGVATLSISYYDLGYTTGEMAVKILNGESDISTMPIEYTDVTKKYNKAICDDLGLTVPEGYEEIEA